MLRTDKMQQMNYCPLRVSKWSPHDNWVALIDTYNAFWHWQCNRGDDAEVNRSQWDGCVQGSPDSPQLLLAKFLDVFQNRLFPCYGSTEPAGKWDKIALNLFKMTRPWEMGFAVVGLNTQSLKTWFQLMWMSAACRACKSSCCFVTYVGLVETQKPEWCKPEDFMSTCATARPHMSHSSLPNHTQAVSAQIKIQVFV